MSQVSLSKYTIVSEKHIVFSTKKLFVFLIFLDWMIYENIIFLEPEFFGGKPFLLLVFAYKLIFPFVLLLYTGLPSFKVLRTAKFSFHFAAFLGFLLWSIIPTIIGGEILSWFKLIPVFVLYVAVVAFFDKNPETFIFFIKLLVGYISIALIQYILIHLTQTYEGVSESSKLTGPFGLFGVTQSRFYLPGLSNPVIRLCGFWKEPSNAAASAYAGFFLSRYLYALGLGKKWKYYSFLCLSTGLLTLSNAGYLAFGSALFLLILTWKKWSPAKVFRLIIFSPFIIGMLWLALFSRSYFAEHGTDSLFLLAITGVRSMDTDASGEYDPSSGRFDLMEDAFAQTLNNFVGKGIQTVGVGGIASPASAPFMWLFLSGFPGLFFIMLREGTILISIKRLIKRSPVSLYLAQAFLVVMVQQAVYGSWMDPNFLIYSAVLILGLKNVKQETQNI